MYQMRITLSVDGIGKELFRQAEALGITGSGGDG
jgi:hypothetical protein